MNNFHEAIPFSLKVVDIDVNEKLIKNGSEISIDEAIILAIANIIIGYIFGFLKIGDDLRIRKLPHF